MRGIKSKALAATLVAVVATVGPLLWTGGTSAALGAPGHHVVNGTMSGDRLSGTGGSDLIAGQGGADVIRPNRGSDLVRAAGGDDRIFLFNDGDVDRIHCGDGFDIVAYQFSVDQHDIIDANCEGRIA